MLTNFRRLLIAAIAALALTAMPAAAEPHSSTPGLKQGQAAFNAGQYDRAFSLWQTEASQGNADAQVFTGLAYANGWGVAKNAELASVWFLKAARNNHVDGQLLAGLHFIQKTGPDRAIGLQWLQRAAKAGDPTAQAFLRKGQERGWFKDITVSQSRVSEAVTKANPLALASQ